jgi:hypothetical protein
MKLLAVALLALAVPASAVGALEVKLSVVPKAPNVGRRVDHSAPSVLGVQAG